jgi:hypothetical protein
VTDTRTGEVTGPAGQWPVMAQLPVLDRFLPVWIGAAMAAGLPADEQEHGRGHRVGLGSASSETSTCVYFDKC